MSVLLWNSMQTRSAQLSTAGAWGYQLKEMLTGAGFVVRSSGTGSSGSGSGVFNASGDSIASEAIMGNPDAWYMIESPDGARQWVIKHNGSGTGQSAWYSKGALFAGGTASTQPTAADNYTLSNANFAGSLGDFGVGAVEAAAPYSWWWGIVTSGGSLGFSLVHFAVEAFDPLDGDPYIFKPESATQAWNSIVTHAGWLPDGSAVVTNWDRDTPNPFPGAGATAYGFVWFWQSVAGANKGWCRRYAQHTHDNNTDARMFSQDGVANSFIKIANAVLPWDNSVPLGPGAPTWNNLGDIVFPQDLLKGC